MSARIKAALGLTAAGIFASVLVPSAAHAAGVNFRFCNVSGNINPHDEYVSFPYRGWFSSTIQPPGGCWSANLTGVASDEAVGYRNINGQWLAVATKYFSDSAGSVEFDF
ncbi:hypothetical protein OG417_54030 [Actinoallomurus sp. NBC_01490]|jgi:hypothetical protein|uniref:hypothetical protein n=1 Tax=Actinoallomurus sp. NBC_01490 TaxID=2903557 RepID=UPI002E33C14B|nr:hypothetical protein [Actinoallomurus sp. NBC_01490]